MSLTIYRSSAGSGKTYTLAREYLKLALRAEDYYQKILAVTFTNRAAEEMKERVLGFLIDIAEGRHELIPYYARELNTSNTEIKEAANRSLTHLLHHYGYFNITTIDTFFHRIIRSFSREIGLQGSFGIELEDEKVAEYITHAVYDGVEQNQQLKDWLVSYAITGLTNGKGYEVRKGLKELAEELFKEEFKKLPADQFSSADVKKRIDKLKEQLIDTKNRFEDHLIKLANQFKQSLAQASLSADDLFHKQSGPAGFFTKLESKKYDNLLTKRLEVALEDPIGWTSKTSKRKDDILQVAGQSLMPLAREALEYLQAHRKDYYTAKAVLKHLYTLGLMSDLATKLQEYKQENEVIMISDLPDFLSQIIDDSGSPFIYEKVGAWYSHYLIDEFQDTSQFQWNNFKPLLEESLANGHENIIVGDAKQSIYGWRGGDPTLLLQKVKEDLPIARFDESKNINWRSAKNIVTFNNDLFTALPQMLVEGMGDTISQVEREQIWMTYAQVAQEVSEANSTIEGRVRVQFVAAEDKSQNKALAIRETITQIEQLLRDGHALSDMAILVRNNGEARDIVNYVLDYRRTNPTDIEVISADGMLLENSLAVQLLLSAFRYLIDPGDISVLASLVYRYQKSVLGVDYSSHGAFAQLTTEGLPPAFVKYQQHLLHLPILEMLEVMIRTFQLDKVTSDYAFIQAFQDSVLEFSKNNRSDLRLFMEWWEERGSKRSVQLTGALEAIEVITSHKSKGLQYPIVFVPFCNFRMDSKIKPVWYDSPYQEWENLPVDYKGELSETFFSEAYKRDIAKWHLESLNVLYVALTRAETGLFVYCEPPSTTAKNNYYQANALLYSYFQQNTPAQWDQENALFDIGHIPPKAPKEKDAIISLEKYASHKWSQKLQVRKTGKIYYQDQAETNRNEGILLHQILSEIKHHADTTKVLDKYERGMHITSMDRKRYESILQNLWQDEAIRYWFDGHGEIKTEVVVLPREGEIKRMDRVCIEGDRATVIDFKNGTPKQSDQAQVANYKNLLKDMGYRAEGYLLYLQPMEFCKV